MVYGCVRENVTITRDYCNCNNHNFYFLWTFFLVTLPPGFSPVPKNNSRKQIAPGYSSLSNTNGNGDAAMMSKLADLGFGASIGGASNNAASTTKPKKYVSARGGYKLRL